MSDAALVTVGIVALVAMVALNVVSVCMKLRRRRRPY